MRGGDEGSPTEAVDGIALAYALEEVRCMGLSVDSEISFQPSVVVAGVEGNLECWPLDGVESDDDDERDFLVAEGLCEASVASMKAAIEVTDVAEGARIEALKAQFFDEFGATSLSGVCPVDPPIRGPYGEAEIWLKPDAKPVCVPQYRFAGERREAHVHLIDEVLKAGKVEPGRGPWNTPSFPVPKKRPGEYRLVQDLRPQNEATIKDGHPLPLIGAILQRQGKYRMWTVLDLTDGYHQMPMKPEHRHITCMSTPRGTMQWKVQVMGLKNAGAQFQRMMEWVLRDIENADPYIDDIIIGSTGDSEEELLENHARDVRRVLEVLRENHLVASPKKSHFFMRQVEFCGHILREGRRSPAPGKLMPFSNGSCPTLSRSCGRSWGCATISVNTCPTMPSLPGL